MGGPRAKRPQPCAPAAATPVARVFLLRKLEKDHAEGADVPAVQSVSVVPVDSTEYHGLIT